MWVPWSVGRRTGGWAVGERAGGRVGTCSLSCMLGWQAVLVAPRYVALLHYVPPCRAARGRAVPCQSQIPAAASRSAVPCRANAFRGLSPLLRSPRRAASDCLKSARATRYMKCRSGWHARRIASLAPRGIIRRNLSKPAPEGSVSGTCRHCCVAASARLRARLRAPCWCWRCRSEPQLIPTLRCTRPRGTTLPHPRACQLVGPVSGSCWAEGCPTF